MVEEAERILAYLCPTCRQSVVVEHSVSQPAVSVNELPCPCGKSSLRVELMGDRAKLTVSCLFCGKDHTITCSSHAFLHEKVLALPYAASGLGCCYMGEEGPVSAALQRLEETVDRLEVTLGEKGVFLDGLVVQEVLSELKETAQRDGILRICGSHHWKPQVNFGSTDLFCADCGGATRIPVATASDIDDICCKNKLVVYGQD